MQTTWSKSSAVTRDTDSHIGMLTAPSITKRYLKHLLKHVKRPYISRRVPACVRSRSDTTVTLQSRSRPSWPAPQRSSQLSPRSGSHRAEDRSPGAAPFLRPLPAVNDRPPRRPDTGHGRHPTLAAATVTGTWPLPFGSTPRRSRPAALPVATHRAGGRGTPASLERLPPPAASRRRHVAGATRMPGPARPHRPPSAWPRPYLRGAG